MRIGILGSGLMGAKLGAIFARAGHEVAFSYARTRKKLETVAQEAGHGARVGSPAEAVSGADLVLLAVHWSRMRDVFDQAGDLAGKTVVSCSLPMNADDTELVAGLTSSGAEQLAAMIPKAHLVGAFGTVPSEVLFEVFEARGGKTRPSMLYYGDHAPSKEVVATLIRDAGFEALDAGPLQTARFAEPFSLLVAQLAYEGDRGPEMAYRFTWMR